MIQQARDNNGDGALRMVVAARGLHYRPDEGVLLGRRSDNGLWELFGGKVAPTDAYARTALAEEWREEAKYPIIVTSIPVYVWDRPAGFIGREDKYEPGTHYICVIYLVIDAYPGLKLNPIINPQIHSEWRRVKLPEGLQELGHQVPEETRRGIDRFYQDRILGPKTLVERCDGIRMSLISALGKHSSTMTDELRSDLLDTIKLSNELLSLKIV